MYKNSNAFCKIEELQSFLHIETERIFIQCSKYFCPGVIKINNHRKRSKYLKVSDYIAQKVFEAGIRDVFMVTGGGAMHLDDSFGHSPNLQCTFNHNEQASAMAAEAYARLNNRPAAVLVTTGPGAVNTLTGVLCAWMESIPMLVISGQARFETTVRGMGLKLRSTGIQEYDVVRSASPMTKYAVMTEHKEDVRYCVEKALYLMMAGRRGPVWLDIPLDVQAADIEPEKLRGYDPSENPEEVPSPISDETVRKILQKLHEAERPVLFGGYGVRAAGAVREFREFKDLLGVPVLTGMSSVDLVTEDDPYYAGRTGMTGNRSGNFAMAGSDLFLSIGSRQSFLQTGFDYTEWARGAYTILNDLDAEELRKPNLHVSLPVVGDARELLEKLIGALQTEGYTKEHPLYENSGWLKRNLERKKKYPVVTEEEKKPLPDGKTNIYRFYDVLSDALPEGAQVIGSCGTSRVAGTQTFRIKKGQRFYTNSDTASMGYDLPASIGLARSTQTWNSLTKGQKTDPVINLVTGEGSLMMNLQELQTIATNHLPVRIFLIQNGGYHSIRQTQNAYFGKPLIGVGPESGDLEFPDPGDLARTFHFSHGALTSNETIEKEMRKALALPLPAIIEVHCSTLQKTMPKAASRKLPDGTMVSAPLEDMAPFLDRKELAENVEIPLTENEKKR